MYSYKIDLIGMKDIQEFIQSISNCKKKVYIKSNEYIGNAKSILNVIASIEWGDLYCSSEEDIYKYIFKWIKDQ